ncbi:hypothetical protein SAMN04488540_10987 [Ferrimonas sediminum]|uniref:Uncharacterized protein n=1 Tax=Ferrimonas sediminum TaxID=718193 RepID=A0A1G8UH32_9GAMM|nr:hypothetical protein SAMN04488540_10987 [Ferrimonas sediminum]
MSNKNNQKMVDWIAVAFAAFCPAFILALLAGIN